MRRAFVASTLVLLMAVLSARSGQALAQAGPPPTPPAGPSGHITLAYQTPWVAPDGDYELRIDVARLSRGESAELIVTVHQAVTSRSQFAQTLQDNRLGDELWQGPPAPLAGAETDKAATVGVTVGLQEPGGPTDPARLVLSQPGVHPVAVELRDRATGAPIDRFVTHLVRLRGDDAVPLAVAWIQPVTAPPALRPDGNVVLGAADRDALATTIDSLAGNPVPLTVVPGPETLDALATTDPDLLARLSASSSARQVVAGPYVDVNVDALVGAGLVEEVAAQQTRGRQAVRTRLDVPVDEATWISEGPLAPGSLAALDGAQRLVVPEAALTPLDRSLTLTSPFLVTGPDGRRLEAVASDDALAAHFVEGDDQVLAAHQLLADLAVLAYDAPGLTRGVVVAPPTGWPPSAAFLTTALDALARGPLVRPVTLDQLFSQVPPAATAGTSLVRNLAPSPPPAFGLTPAEFGKARADVASLIAMTGPGGGPSGADGDLLERLLLVAAARPLSEPERRAYLTGAEQTLGERLAKVGVLSGGSFRLTARKTSIPLTLVNDLDVDVAVSLRLDSDKLDFTDARPRTARGATIPLTLHPGNTPVMVPVEVRTSGDFPLIITLRSPDGRLEVASTRLTVRSTFLSGAGVALSAGAGLFLLGWWARHWRTTRRDRRLIDSAGPEG